MQDIDEQRRRNEAQLSRADPKKAAQAERLGMALGGAQAAKANAHSVASGIVEIQQEGISRGGAKAASRFNDDGLSFASRSARDGDRADTFYDAQDDWTVLSSEPQARRYLTCFVLYKHLCSAVRVQPYGSIFSNRWDDDVSKPSQATKMTAVDSSNDFSSWAEEKEE